MRYIDEMDGPHVGNGWLGVVYDLERVVDADCVEPEFIAGIEKPLSKSTVELVGSDIADA